jgi:signal transduction histidine kinase/CheY-like chemotaxis protein
MTGFRWTIKRKLLALGGAALLPLLLLLVFWAWREVRQHTELAGAELTLASQQAGSQVEELVDQVRRHLHILARDRAIQRRQVDQMEARFRDTIAEHREIENLAAFTADGRTLATAVSQPAGAPVTAADRPWFQQVIGTGQPAVGDFQIGRITGQPVAIVAVPLREGEGPLTGVLVAALSLRRLHAIFQSLPLTGGRAVTVVDGEVRVLSHAPKVEGWIGRGLPSAAGLPQGPAVVRRLAWFEGEERIVAVTPVAGTGWRVLVGIPHASVEARIWKEVLDIALPLLALLAVSGLVGLLIARRVWRPLQALAEAARRLPREGKVRVLTDSTDEVGELARAFSAMAAQVAESRAGLERRVAELTALFEAGRLLTGTLEFSEVLQRLAEIARTRLEVDVVRIWLWDRTTESLVLQTHQGVTRLEVDFRTRLGVREGLAGWIVTNRRSLVVPHVQKDPRLVNREWIQAEGVLSFLGVPLLLQEASLGVLACMCRTHRDFSSEEVVLAEALAAQAAIAIENARLVEGLQRAMEELKAAQDQLVQGAALRAVGELASGVAHHLNNILAVIGGRVQLVLREVQQPSHRHSLEIAARAVVKGAEVIRQIRGFSQPQSVSEAIPVDLNRLVQEALELTRPRWQDQAQARGIAIEASLEAGQIPPVAGDPSSLKEVLVNLLFNAVDALPTGGRITVKTWASPRWVHCSVTDTGVGMSKEVRRQALEPFFTTKGPKSTGLGLSVTYGIVQRHGGEMAIESAEEQGATVTISLPVAPVAPGGGPAPDTPPASVSAGRILVIDDEAEVRATLAEILASQGHLVSQAASGAEGVSLFQVHHHDLVLTDLGMPGMTGWRVAEAVKALSPATPVVLLTGWDDEVARPEANAGRVDQIMRKPFDLEDVAAVVAKALAASCSGWSCSSRETR